MEKTIVVEGKTSAQAIEKGLMELNCKREDVEVKVLENEEKRSFFSILEPRIVKVELTLKKEKNKFEEKKVKIVSEEDFNICKENINKFMQDFTKCIEGISAEVKKEKDMICVEISGDSASKLIGHRGETINALQTIVSVIGNKNVKNRVKISVDICDYKEKREMTLKELARKLERTVKKTGKKIVLEPMSSYERKIIHTELQESEYVTTYSIGEEPRRKVVIDKK